MSSTRRGSKRRHANDDYQTPWPFAAQIAERLVKDGLLQPGMRVLEPAAGEGRLLRCVQHYCPEVGRLRAVELNPRYMEGLMEYRPAMGDFTSWVTLEKFDLILTNPPFSLTEQFIRRGVSLLAPGGRLILLQRLALMAGKDRQDYLWRVQEYDRLYVCSSRPNFIVGVKGKSGDSADYGWYGFVSPMEAPALGRRSDRPRTVTITHLRKPKEVDPCLLAPKRRRFQPKGLLPKRRPPKRRHGLSAARRTR